mgnify:CR=1 FL=1
MIKLEILIVLNEPGLIVTLTLSLSTLIKSMVVSIIVFSADKTDFEVPQLYNNVRKTYRINNFFMYA